MDITRKNREDAGITVQPNTDDNRIEFAIRDHDGDYAVVWLKRSEAREVAARLITAAAYQEIDYSALAFDLSA